MLEQFVNVYVSAVTCVSFHLMYVAALFPVIMWEIY